MLKVRCPQPGAGLRLQLQLRGLGLLTGVTEAGRAHSFPGDQPCPETLRGVKLGAQTRCLIAAPSANSNVQGKAELKITVRGMSRWGEPRE